MKHFRFAACLLVFIFMFAFVCGVSAETVTLSLMGLERDGTDRIWAESNFFARMAEQTGVSFVFEQFYDEAHYLAALEEAFSPNGILPEVLFKANLTPQQEIKWLDSGCLIDLAPLLEEHAPNLWAILEARPDFREAITQPGGAIASLPAIVGTPRQPSIWINAEWLETLELSLPATIDEFSDILRAFRDLDPNQNRKADERPLSLIGPFEAKFLLHAFGLVPNDYNIFEIDGIVRFAPFEPAYREFVEWLATAHAEGLLDDNAFRAMQASRTTELAADRDAPLTIGCMVTVAPYHIVDMEQTTDYIVLPPLMYEGGQVYRRMIGSVSRGTFAVTSACSNVPAALRFVDALYTESGGRLAFAGLENEDYFMQSNGAWSWTDGKDYSMLAEKLSKSIITGGDALTPGLEPAAFMRNSEIKADNYARTQTDTLTPYLVDPFPLLWPSDPALETRIGTLQSVLAPAVDTAIAEFATGKRPLTDDEWALFEQELRLLGADEFTQLLQQALDERFGAS
ncbi:MAG: hypothetical protein FWG37_06310 [Clostridia bacterium]|nr:hypothetical protein [Clostridia bacterium]